MATTLLYNNINKVGSILKVFVSVDVWSLSTLDLNLSFGWSITLLSRWLTWRTNRRGSIIFLFYLINRNFLLFWRHLQLLAKCQKWFTLKVSLSCDTSKSVPLYNITICFRVQWHYLNNVIINSLYWKGYAGSLIWIKMIKYVRE